MAKSKSAVLAHSDDSIKMIDTLIFNAQKLMSNEETILGAYDELRHALELSVKYEYKLGVIQSYENLGNYYLTLSDNVNATSYLYLMLKEAEAINDTLFVGKAHTGLGLVMYNMSKWHVALSYLNKAEANFRTLDKQPRELKLITYLQGLCLVRQNNFHDAQPLLEYSHQKAIEDGDSMRIFETWLALNRIAIEQGNDSTSLSDLEQIQAFFESRDEIIGVSYALQGKAMVYLLKGDGEKASHYAKASLQLAQNLGIIYPISEVLTTLIKAERLNGDFESALDYQEWFNRLKDSTTNIEVATEIAMLGAAHNFEKKEAQYNAEIETEAKQRRFYLGLFITTLFIALIIVVMLRLVAKQRHKSDRLLRNILPRHTIDELRNHGHAVSKAHENVTIVFADVIGFTKIASSLEPDILVQMLDRYFIEYDRIIKKYKLEKIKTIGDAYMFVAGLVPESESVNQAASACLEMVNSVKLMSEAMKNEFGTHFEFRFGMHVGSVVSGVVGDIKYAFDIWGDAVNIAARMEEHSEAMKINISPETEQLLRAKFNCKARGVFDIKNRGPLEMFYLESEKTSLD